MSSQAAPIRVALVEDDRQVREGLEALIKTAPDLVCVAACSTAEEAAARVPSLDADVVLTDLHLPSKACLDCIRQLKRVLPGVHIMMLTVFEDDERLFQFLAAGASSYVPKHSPPPELFGMIRQLHRGASPLSAQIARRVAEIFQQPDPATGVGVRLSPLEHDILQLLSKGLLDGEVAGHLQLPPEKVRTHLHDIYDKLHVRTRSETRVKVFHPRTTA